MTIRGPVRITGKRPAWVDAYGHKNLYASVVRFPSEAAAERELLRMRNNYGMIPVQET